MITSGAIQKGVPMKVVCFCSVCLFLADTPKSAAASAAVRLTDKGAGEHSGARVVGL